MVPSCGRATALRQAPSRQRYPQRIHGQQPFDLVSLNNTLYFAANDGIRGTELWQTDGSAAGTVLVKDINSGSGLPIPREWSP